ncbi:hypothetical protein [Bradyrhizobium diazoefficiens]
MEAVWIASSHQRKIATQFCRELLAMTALMQLCATIPAVVIASSNTQPPQVAIATAIGHDAVGNLWGME